MPGSTAHILLPTYEPRPDFIRAAVESAIAQTEARWTLHINDDASNTDVHTIVQPYLKDSRITFTRNTKRRGIGGNWNACLREAGRAKPDVPFIQFLFQDDLWDQSYLEQTCRILETHPTVGFVSVEHEYDYEEGIPTTKLYEELRAFRSEHIAPGIHRGEELLDWWLLRSLHPNIIGEPSFVMMRRSLIERVGMFDRHMSQFLDVEYWTRCLAKADWYYLGKNLGTFRVHGGGASEQNRRKGRGMVDRLLCIERALKFLPQEQRRDATGILTQTFRSMVKKFHTQEQSPHTKHNPLHLLPLLPFCLRHPLIVGKTLLGLASLQKSLR